MKIEIEIPDDLHPDTAALVAAFAQALAEKLRKSEIKHGYSDGWKDKHWQHECSQQLIRHLAKGDPIDVAVYCAFMWHHKWRTLIVIPS